MSYRVTNISGDRTKVALRRGAIIEEPSLFGRILRMGKSVTITDNQHRRSLVTLTVLKNRGVISIDHLLHAATPTLGIPEPMEEVKPLPDIVGDSPVVATTEELKMEQLLEAAVEEAQTPEVSEAPIEEALSKEVGKRGRKKNG